MAADTASSERGSTGSIEANTPAIDSRPASSAAADDRMMTESAPKRSSISPMSSRRSFGRFHSATEKNMNSGTTDLVRRGASRSRVSAFEPKANLVPNVSTGIASGYQ